MSESATGGIGPQVPRHAVHQGKTEERALHDEEIHLRLGDWLARPADALLAVGAGEVQGLARAGERLLRALVRPAGACGERRRRAADHSKRFSLLWGPPWGCNRRRHRPKRKQRPRCGTTGGRSDISSKAGKLRGAKASGECGNPSSPVVPHPCGQVMLEYMSVVRVHFPPCMRPMSSHSVRLLAYDSGTSKCENCPASASGLCSRTAKSAWATAMAMSASTWESADTAHSG